MFTNFSRSFNKLPIQKNKHGYINSITFNNYASSKLSLKNIATPLQTLELNQLQNQQIPKQYETKFKYGYSNYYYVLLGLIGSSLVLANYYQVLGESASQTSKNNNKSLNSQKLSQNKSESKPALSVKDQKNSEYLKDKNAKNTKENEGEPIPVFNGPTVAKVIQPKSFEQENHYYERVLNAQLHPMVGSFLHLGLERIVERYCHLNPNVDPEELLKYLQYKPKNLRWSGADLFVVTNQQANKQICIIEVNTCPSGQKSMPLMVEHHDQGGYEILINETFKPLLDDVDPELKKEGVLAVVYDKNDAETSGYAASMADQFNEPVYLVKYYDNDPDPGVKFDTKGIMYVRIIDNNGKHIWKPVRGAFRYVTQRPWNRIPIATKTKILNPVITCLAGGRNKNIASKAYAELNGILRSNPGLSALQIHVPETIEDVSKINIPMIINNRFGGVAVIKNPYSNAGQGVYTITNQQELDEFMNDPSTEAYDKFIVQALIGNAGWSSLTPTGRLYHVGTVPNKQKQTFAADIRMMVHYTNKGWQPLCVYSRRAKLPLVKDLNELKDKGSSWDMLGTNLSIKIGPNKWTTDTHRLIIMDRKDFNKLGIGTDDLIDAYIQTVLASIAIDKMSERLLHPSTNKFNSQIFKAYNNDVSLINEILT